MKKLALKLMTTLLLMTMLGTLVGVQPARAASIVVNSNADTVANDGVCTLREAITAANTNAASGAAVGECAAGAVAGTDAISFAANYQITLTSLSQLPAVTSAITITGNGAANSVVLANACDPLGGFCTHPNRVFEVGAAGNLILDGLTVKHGSCFSGACATNTGQGGNILNAGILQIANSIVTNANALSGGNIYNNGGTITVIASQINSGRAYDGGGIYNFSGAVTLSQVTMSGDQSVGLEGAAINNQATLTVTNSTFSGNGDFINNTGTAAGAIYNSPTGTATITNSTFSGNAGGLSGGIQNIGVLHLSNTILANNSPIDCYNSAGDTIATNTNNLIEVNAASGHMCGTPSLTSDPMLGALTNNGGSTPTFALLAGSPAIDAGSNAVCQAAPVNNLDQRGVTRPLDGDLTGAVTCDIGSYEFDPAPTVTSIVRASANPSGSASVSFTVTFSETVQDVSAADFALTKTGSITGESIGTVSGSGAVYTVPVNTGTGSGTLRLDVPVTASITDAGTNPISGLPYSAGQVYTIDKASPTVVSIVRVNPSPTSAASVSFTVTFSEAVQGVSAADFALTKTGGIAGESVGTVSGSGAIYTVAVNTGTGNGTLRLDVPVSASILDLAGNPIASLPFITGQSYAVKKTLSVLSSGTEDGWVLESGENTNVGGTMNNGATTFRIGDDAARKQYRGILSFDTSALPDNAVITKVTLKVKQQGIVGGGNPVSAFQGFMVDIRKGFFGASALQLTDWQATAHKTIGPFSPTLSGGFYTLDLTSAKAQINKLATGSGLTQIRLRFKLGDDNNATANFLSLFSGNAGAASRPQLIVEYSIP